MAAIINYLTARGFDIKVPEIEGKWDRASVDSMNFAIYEATGISNFINADLPFDPLEALRDLQVKLNTIKRTT